MARVEYWNEYAEDEDGHEVFLAEVTARIEDDGMDNWSLEELWTRPKDPELEQRLWDDAEGTVQKALDARYK